MQELNRSVELGALLATTIESVAKAQERMDQYSRQRREEFENAEDGELVLPPIWYAFTNVAIELELTSQVSVIKDPDTGKEEPHLYSRTLNPQSVGLYGHRASAGLRVRLDMAPQGTMYIKAKRNDNAVQESENQGEQD